VPDEAAADAPLPSLGGESIPLCTEPWQSLYILRRGVMPCCHGKRPIAKMDEYREAWNSTLLQEIRRDLVAGTLHAYCLESTSCPIVRKAVASGEVAAPTPAQPPEPPPAEVTLVGRLRDRASAVWQRVRAGG
jgi:hypothetical protein